jgi:outer membrane protein OmpA-like peptidoglycan-associated protein
MASGGRRLFGGSEEETPWLGIADMMSGLMVIFIFISVANMRDQQDLTTKAEVAQVEAEKARKKAEANDRRRAVSAEKINIAWTAMKDQEKRLVQVLRQAFATEVEQGKLEILEEPLTVNFTGDVVDYCDACSGVPNEFRKTLRTFVPDLLDVIRRPIEGEAESIVEEVRIEGHTSSPWSSRKGERKTTEEKYLKNLALSQSRARKVLEFILKDVLEKSPNHRTWVQRHVSATGRSSSQVIGKGDCDPYLDQTCEEDLKRSKRVSFRLRTTEHTRLRQLVNEQLPQLIHAVESDEDSTSTDAQSDDD